MDFIPLVCGTYPRAKAHAVGADCPVCGGRRSVDLVESYQRCCCCFVPLCVVGGRSNAAVCSMCGARMPPGAARAYLRQYQAAEGGPLMGAGIAGGAGTMLGGPDTGVYVVDQYGGVGAVPTAQVVRDTDLPVAAPVAPGAVGAAGTGMAGGGTQKPTQPPPGVARRSGW